MTIDTKQEQNKLRDQLQFLMTQKYGTIPVADADWATPQPAITMGLAYHSSYFIFI